MDDITKYLVAFDDECPFELPAESLEEAEAQVKRDFQAYGEVRVLEVVYRPICTTPHIVKTK